MNIEDRGPQTGPSGVGGTAGDELPDEVEALFAAAVCGLGLLEASGTGWQVLRVNAALAARLGLPPGRRAVGLLDQVMPDLAPALAGPLERTRQGHATAGLELIRAGASLLVNLVPLAGGERVAMGLVDRDALGGSASWETPGRDELLEALGQHSPDMVYAKDLQGRLTYANTALLDLLGLELPAVLGRTLKELMPQWGGSRKLAAALRAVEEGRPARRDEVVIPPTGSGTRVLNTFHAPLRGAAGRLIGLVALARDVTEERASEARSAFLLRLSDTLRAAANPALAALEVICDFLGAPRAAFVRITPGAGLDLAAEWPGSSAPGDLPDLGAVLAQLNQGQVVPLDGEARAVPVLHEGRLVAALVLWGPMRPDIRAIFLSELAERSWTAHARAQIEQQLRCTEERHRRVLEATTAVVWSTDAEGNFDRPQPGWATYTGQAWPDHAGMGWTRMIHPEDLEALLADWHAAVAGARDYVSEGRLWHAPTESWRRFVVRGIPLQGPDGQPREWIGAVTDIEDQRRAEARQKASEQRLRLAKEATGLAIFELEIPDGRLTWEGDELARLGWAPPPPATLAEFARRLTPEAGAALEAGIAQALASGGSGRMAVELRCLPSGRGGPEWLAVMAQRVRDCGGLRLVGSLRDITDAKATELGLHRSNRDLSARVEEMAAERERLWAVTEDLLATADLQGRLHNLSASWAWVLGLDPVALQGVRAPDILHPEDLPQLVAALHQLRRTGGTMAAELRLRAADGSWRRIHFRLTHDRDVPRIYAVGRDITVERAQAEALAQAQAQLHEAQKLEAMGRLTGGVAHDFNNLLAAVLSNLHAARRQVQEPRLLRQIGSAIEAAERGATLTGRLLSFARRQELRVQPVAVGPLVLGLQDLVRSTIGSGVDLHLELPEPVTVACDPNQLELALLNLCSNARDAMAGKGDLTIALRRAEGFGVLSVSDTGCGMDAATLDKATEPFFTTKDPGKGTGLGLSMVHGFAAQSGGRLGLDSQPGRGTRVEIWLPLAQPAPAASKPAEPERRWGAALRILVVEDDFLVAMGTLAMLEDMGHDARAVHSARAALDAVREGPAPDLILTDHVMPGMTGIDLVRALRAEGVDAPVILTSGHADLATDMPVRHLSKPFGPLELAQAIAEACPMEA